MLSVERYRCVHIAIGFIVDEFDTRDDYDEAAQEIYQKAFDEDSIEKGSLPEGLIISKGYLIGSLYRICDYLYDLGYYQEELERLGYTQEDIDNDCDIHTAIQNVVQGSENIFPYGFEDDDVEVIHYFGVDEDTVCAINQTYPSITRFDFWTKSRVALFKAVKERCENDSRLEDVLNVLIADAVLKANPLKHNENLAGYVEGRLKEVVWENLQDELA